MQHFERFTNILGNLPRLVIRQSFALSFHHYQGAFAFVQFTVLKIFGDQALYALSANLQLVGKLSGKNCSWPASMVIPFLCRPMEKMLWGDRARMVMVLMMQATIMGRMMW